MIYILEGCHGGGKSTYAEKLKEQGYEIKRGSIRDIDNIRKALTHPIDAKIVFDRLCLLRWKKHSDLWFIELNNILQSFGDTIKCVKFVGGVDRAVARMKEHNAQNGISKTDEEIRAEMEEEKAYFERVFALMPIFVEP